MTPGFAGEINREELSCHFGAIAIKISLDTIKKEKVVIPSSFNSTYTPYKYGVKKKN